ncbi:MAG: class IV adenylate cyclase [Planctomycetaceae bacterium]|jgi:adenylate cyclase class 2|nr:class IV adenylate cyclase [Planctomycetaceae bacterium]
MCEKKLSQKDCLYLSMDTYEVEVKFRVDDVDEIERRLGELGINFSAEAVEEVDKFYAHPQRNFNQTDECLRLRVRKFVDGNEEKFLTYKGAKLDTTTKTRRELEIKIDDAATLELILELLGFQAVDFVRKFRRHAETIVDSTAVEFLLDFIPELADKTNGNFIEIETIATETDIESKRNLILNLAKKLNLTDSIRTSYLGLLRRKRIARSGMIS